MIISRLAKPKIAKKDIVVYKVMEIKDGIYYRSYFRYFVYVKDKVYTTTIERETDSCKMTACDLREKEDYNVNTCMTPSDSMITREIGMDECLARKNLVMYSKGFHSYASLTRVSSEIDDDAAIIVKCIIPAGALYMKSKSDLYISNQIIIKEDVSIDREES